MLTTPEDAGITEGDDFPSRKEKLVKFFETDARYQAADIDIFLCGRDLTGELSESVFSRLYNYIRDKLPRVLALDTPVTITLVAGFPYKNIQITMK
jgi:hypothetical protein